MTVPRVLNSMKSAGLPDPAHNFILSIDTALGPCSVGLLDVASGEGVSRIVHEERAQAKILVPLIEEVLAEAGKTFEGIDAIVTTVGPGSFTGLRLSLSTARSLGLALNKPVIGITTLDAAAHQVLQGQEAKTACIVLETKRQDFYARAYHSDLSPMMEMCASSGSDIIEQLPDSIDILSGDATRRFVENCGDGRAMFGEILPMEALDPLLLGALAMREEIHYDALPVYLRGADVSSPKRVQRVISKA